MPTGSCGSPTAPSRSPVHTSSCCAATAATPRRTASRRATAAGRTICPSPTSRETEELTMWSQADDSLRRRDPQLGHLRQVLDADYAAELLTAALPGFGITDVEPEYVRYKPQTSCLVNYRIKIG